jgi:inhibitor of the pro-sigma K processing machinery
MDLPVDYGVVIMEINFGIVLAYALGLLLLYLVGWLLLVPVKLIIRLIYNGIVGGIMLWLLNLIGGLFGFGIAINPVTALVAGFLGIPGVVLLIVLQYML